MLIAHAWAHLSLLDKQVLLFSFPPDLSLSLLATGKLQEPWHPVTAYLNLKDAQ